MKKTIFELEKNLEESQTKLKTRNHEELKEEVSVLREQNQHYQKENIDRQKAYTILERENLSLQRKASAMEESISELTEKNVQLGKLVDERVYTISGELAKREMAI